jgi:predicted AlkP superfamily phosphohydrolase/phosphomutase
LNVWLAERGHLGWQDESVRDASGALTVERLKSHVGLLDWDRTTAFCLTPSSNGVFIRRAEAGGPGVRPEDYESFRQRLADDLLAWRDPGDGGQVVTSVLTREQAYPGSAMESAPDLLLSLRDGGFVSILNADRPLAPRPVVLGTHRPEGVFLAAGPGIESGECGEAVHLVDATPIALYSLGLPIPENLEGRVPDDVFSAEQMRARAVEIGPPTLAPDPFPERRASREDTALEAEAEAEIMERLRALGYVE